MEPGPLLVALASRLPFFPTYPLPFHYGWIIVASAFVILALSYTALYSFSVFFVAILEDFGWSRALTAGAYSVAVLVGGVTGPLAGWLVDRFGVRWVVGLGSLILAAALLACARLTQVWQFYLFFGLLASIGVHATGWVPNVVLVSNWFVHRFGAAVGIIGAGTAFGILLLVPGTQYLISSIGWRPTYSVLAVAVVVVILPTTLLLQRTRPQDMGLSPDGGVEQRMRLDPGRLVVDRAWANRRWTLFSAMGTARCWLVFGAALLVNVALQMVLVHQVALLVDAGYDKMLAAAAVSMLGIASVVAKPIWGMLSDRLGRETVFGLGITCGLIGVALLILARNASAWWLPYLYGLWMGLGFSISAPLIPAISADLFRGKDFGTIFGLMNLGISVGGALGSWVAGYVFDRTGDYLLALVLCLGALITSGVFVWLAAPGKVRLVPGKVRDLDRDHVPVHR